jgi:hypothetical protein
MTQDMRRSSARRRHGEIKPLLPALASLRSAGRSGHVSLPSTQAFRDRPATQRVLAALIVVVFCVGAVAALARRGDDGISGAGRLDTDGKATITRADGSTYQAAGPTTVYDGDVAEAVEGTMLLQLPGGATIEGGPASTRADATKLRAGPVVEVLRGDALLRAHKTTSIVAADNHITVEPPSDGPSATRIGRSLAVTIGGYRGTVRLDSAGQQRTVPPLRKMEVAALGRPPTDPKPLALDHPDAWDLRYLGDAIDLGATLQSLSNGYSPTLRPDEGRTAAHYAAIVSGLEGLAGFGDALVTSARSRPQGELLVGAALVALGRTGDTAQRWASTFAFRDAGATWGLVALDQGVAAAPLLDAVKAAIDHTAFEFAAGTTPASAGPDPAPTTTAPPTTQPDTSATTSTTTSPTATTSPPPTSSPTTEPESPSPTLPSVTVPPLLDGSDDGSIVGPAGTLLAGLLGRGS